MNDHSDKPKWRPWRFSLQFLLLIVLAVALFLGYLQSQMRLNEKINEARKLVDVEIIRLHFMGPFGMQNNASLMNTFRNDLFKTPANFKFTVLQVGPDVVEAKSIAADNLDEFQQESLKRINGGENEVGQHKWDGGFRYVTKLKMPRSCGTCHVLQGNNMNIVVGVDF